MRFNALSQYSPMQTIQAARMGREERERDERKNAFAQAGEAYMGGDYKGAAGALMPYDMGAGIQMAQYGQQQAKTAETEQLRKMYEATQLLAKEPDVMRRIQMAQEMSPGLGIPAPTDPSDYTDDVLQRELDEMRIKGGFEVETPEFGFSKVGDDLIRTNPQTGLAEVAYTAPEAALEPDWQRTTIEQNGLSQIVEYDRNAEDPQSTIRVIGQKPTDQGDTGPDATGEGVLRREFNSLTRQFRDVHSAYNRITATDTSTPAGQMGLIFQYMKMLDPGSTVREGEYATAQNTTGVPGQVLNAYNAALQGKFLTETQIRDFEGQAERLYNRSAEIYGRQVEEYQRLSESYEYDPSRTVVDVRSGNTGPVAQPNQFPNAPPIGSVEDGFRYIGGPPDNPSSWEPTS